MTVILSFVEYVSGSLLRGHRTTRMSESFREETWGVFGEGVIGD